jgi:rhamnulokinase
VERSYIAVDLGAESGRVMLGRVAHGKLDLEQVYRFANGPIEIDGSLRWDFSKLFSEVKKGIAKAAKLAAASPAGIGVDTWGVDFGLIDADGRLIENPYHYRDARTNGMMERAFDLMDKRTIYENSGLQFMQFNTIYQLLAMRLANSASLVKAKKLLFMADLISYHLCGMAYSEYTFASTSQLLNMATGKWSQEIFDAMSLPREIMQDIVQPGTAVGSLKKEIANELECGRIPVVAVGAHDTASAIAAVPAGEGNWAYLSSGTWSLMGVEAPKAIISDTTFKYEFTNEGGVEGTIRLLKNIMGLWLVQECRRQWAKEGQEFGYDELAKMAEEAEPFTAYIAPDCPEFLSPGDMPGRINAHLRRTGQRQIGDKGQMVRAILESLALRYRWVLERIEEITGNHIDCLHIVGGGIQNELLCQFTADAIGRRVITGPIEATASGNILMQAKAAGQIASLAEARQIVRNSFELKEYRPRDTDAWDKQYRKIAK